MSRLYSWSLIFLATIRFLTNPLFLLALAFLTSWIILSKFKKTLEYDYLVNLLFLSLSFFIWQFTGVTFASSSGYLVFAIFLALKIMYNRTAQGLKIFFGFFVLSLIVSALISVILFQVLNEITPQTSTVILLLTNTRIPIFYYYIFPISITSFLLGYCWIRTLDCVLGEIRDIKLSKISVPKAIFLYFQFLPICLLPIFLAQALSRPDLLGSMIFYLNNLCISYVLLFLYSVCIALLGNRLLKTKIYFVGGSIISLLTATITFYLAFQYIALKVNYGSWGLAFTLVPLISYIFGTVAERISIQD